MQNKLFIGNLPYKATDAELQDFFSGAGTVTSATIIKERDSGRSKGFGFVEMSSDQEAEKAIEMLNGQDFQGRAIMVSIARPMTPRA